MQKKIIKIIRKQNKKKESRDGRQCNLKFAIVITFLFHFGPQLVSSNPHIYDFGFVIVIFHLFGRTNSVLCLNRIFANICMEKKFANNFLINPRYSIENRLLLQARGVVYRYSN